MKKKKDVFNNEEILRQEKEFIGYYENQAGPVRMLMRLFRAHYGRMLLGALFYAVKVSPIWIMPIITAKVIDIATIRPDNAVTQFLIYLATVVVVLLLNIPTNTLYVKNMSLARRNVEAGLRGAMVRKLQQLSIPFYKEMESGRIQSKIMRDVEAVEGLSAQITETMLNTVLSFSVSLVIVLVKNRIVFLFFLLSVPAAVFLMRAFNGKMRRANSDLRVEIEHTSADVMDMVELVPVTRAHSVERDEIERLTRQLNIVAQKGYRLDIIQNLFGATSWVIFQIFQVLCLFTTAFLAFKRKISVGDIALYQTYFATIVGQISALVSLIPTVTRGAESIRSIGEILSSHDVENNSGKEKLKDIKGEFDFENVSFHYADDETPVIKNMNLHVKAGETIAFVGSSGSGKSTILNLVTGFYLANSGCVKVDGHDVRDIDLRSYRRHIAVVPQTSVLFSGTIRDNITYGMPDVSEELLNMAVRAANLEEMIALFPKGLDTKVGEHGGKLSGGQRQRISIARAIIRDPKVILFDEATSALDSVSEKEIQTAINNMTDGRTTFIVAHRLSTIRDADRIAVIKDGGVAEIGSFDELMAKKGEFYKLKSLQS